MTVTKTPAEIAAALGETTHFQNLPLEHLLWLAERSEYLELPVGEAIMREGDPADSMYVVLSGEVHFRREQQGDGAVFLMHAGQVGGLLPFSRMERYIGTGRAVVPSRFVRIPAEHFPDMLHRMPELGKRLVGAMSDRIREATRVEQQRDKLTALGKLSAGLAHELNNPAAAAVRATDALQQTVARLRQAISRMDRHTLTDAQRAQLAELEQTVVHAQPGTQLNALDRSDREDELADWLQEHGVKDAWDVAPALIEAGLQCEMLDTVTPDLTDDVIADALERLGATIAVVRLSEEIGGSVQRISALVKSVKEYSFMDQAPEQEIDLHQGIESTLTMLAYQLRGIEVVRQFGAIPRVCAHGSELNQVWTNLIDNAADALKSAGTPRPVLMIRTALEPGLALVEICDNGPGIPAAVLQRIWEPFFTTKAVGQGTGLGLDVVQRVVSRHRGSVRVESQPGATKFQVRLPLQEPANGQR